MKKIAEKAISLENKIGNIIKKDILIFLPLMITVFAIIIRIQFIDQETEDYLIFLKPWFDQLKNDGGLLGLGNYTGNYNYPYVTILAILTYFPINSVVSIKIVSIIFDFILAITCAKIVKLLFRKNKNVNLYSVITYGIILFLPTVLLNSSFWGQCDSIYVAFAMLALLYMLKEKYRRSFIFLGISFAFKLQFIFILPVFIFMYVSKRKFPIYYFLIIPIMNFILCLPAMLCGKGIADILTIYIMQTNFYKDYISLLFPGIYNILMPIKQNGYALNTIQGVEQVGIYITFMILFVVLVILIYKKVDIKGNLLIQMSLWSVMICTFLLPNMHERYLYMGDILSVLYFVISRDWKKIYIPIGINLISLYGYSKLLFGGQILNIQIMSLLNLILVVIITKDIFQKILEKQEMEEV